MPLRPVNLQPQEGGLIDQFLFIPDELENKFHNLSKGHYGDNTPHNFDFATEKHPQK